MRPAEPPAAYVAFDLEATGLSPKTDQVIEIGAVRLDAQLRPQRELELLVDPGIPIPLAIQRLVGLRDEDVAGAPSPVEGMAQLADLAEGAALITHGGVFDMRFCRTLLPSAFSHRLVFDTLELARILLPSAAAHGLPALSREQGLTHTRPHRALSDAGATADLFRHLRARAAALPPESLEAAQRVAAQVEGPLRAFFEDVVPAAPPEDHRPSWPVTAVVANKAEAGDRPPPAVSVQPALSSRPLDEATAAVLSRPAPGEEHFEYREAQVQMGRAVAQALERRRRVVIEAPTGVGKSRGYLVPLALWAARTQERGVVATHTITLQEQLAERDLPAALRATGLDLPVAMLKGRNQYISLRRWQRWLAQPDDGAPHELIEVIRFKLKVLVWLTETQSGDRSELHLTADEEQLWQRVASDTSDCLGTLCANWGNRRCHMVAARVAAQEAAIVVTNHALMLAASERQGQVLPEYAALVIDEAHHLEGAATEQLGATLRAADIALQLDRVTARPGSPLALVITRARDAVARLFGDVKGFVGEELGTGHSGNGRTGLTPERRETARSQALARSARVAFDTLRAAADELQRARDEMELETLIPGATAETDELVLAQATLAQQGDIIRRVLLAPQEGYVAWLELRAEQAELHEAPVSVAQALRELVFDRVDTAVLTSATLAVGDNFDFIKQRAGVGEDADELVLESPFDFLRQALTVVAQSIPPYDDPEHDRVIAALVAECAERLGGRTLVLFTGYGPLRRVHALVHERLETQGIALLGQGIDGTRRQILGSFLDDRRTVLLGTNSFWEGIDVPGDALQCVVIDKLPFAVPTDPLVRARSEMLRDPFAQYILPLAVIRLRQGFGRLIRRATDRGAVVLCDDRLGTRRYADAFLQALPPAPLTRAAVDDIPAMVAAFVHHGVAPQPVGQSWDG